MPVHNAPAYLPPLIGREAELARVAGLLADPAGRLVTLTGPGGIGKTRLALEAAARHDLRPGPADGAWLVELAGLSEPDLVAGAVTAALNLNPRGDRPPVDALAVHLRAWDVLLLLDNCEHVVDACAELVQALLAACPGVRVLATSRQPLQVPGETIWPVSPLSLPEPGEPADALAGSEAVRLFVDRAQRAWPAFALTPANAADVAAVCRHLDGLPLAIELAAPWVRVLSPAQIAARLGQHFQLLTGGGPLPGRHRSLQAALDWSHERLSPAEQVLFRRLSAFAGTFDLEAAEAVCAGDDLERTAVLDLLHQLVGKSLVGVCDDGDPVRRYSLLETTQQYAQARLRAAGEERALRDGHLRWALSLAERIRPYLWGTAGADRVRRLEDERDNMRAALAWAIEDGQVAEGARLAVALGWWWYVRAQLHEGGFWLRRVLDKLPPALPYYRANALNMAGALALLEGDHDRAAALAGEAMRVDCERGCSSVAAWSLHELGMIALNRGDYEQAEELFESSLEAFRALDDPAGTASLILYRGLAACYRGHDERAHALLAESLARLRELGDAVGVARALHGLGLLARHRTDLASSRAHFREALRLAHDQGARLDLATSFGCLAGIAWLEGQPLRAARLLGATHALYEATAGELPAGIRADLDRDTAAVRAALGESLFAEHLTAGRALTLEAACALAYQTGVDAGGRQPDLALTPLQAAKRRYGGLTARERHVASLVAQGKSNAAIASELVITSRTVESHITHVLRKLGFRSRAQLAAWAVDHGLAPAPRGAGEPEPEAIRE